MNYSCGSIRFSFNVNYQQPRTSIRTIIIFGRTSYLFSDGIYHLFDLLVLRWTNMGMHLLHGSWIHSVWYIECVGEPPKGLWQAEKGGISSIVGGWQDIADISDGVLAWWCDVPHSQLPSGEWSKGVVGGVKDDDELRGSSPWLAHRCGMDTVWRQGTLTASMWPLPKIYVKCATLVWLHSLGYEK